MKKEGSHIHAFMPRWSDGVTACLECGVSVFDLAAQVLEKQRQLAEMMPGRPQEPFGGSVGMPKPEQWLRGWTEQDEERFHRQYEADGWTL